MALSIGNKAGAVGVFGANGFIGRALTLKLLNEGKSVRAVSRGFDESFLAQFNDRDGLEIVVGELEDRDSMMRALEGLGAVFQLMSTASPGIGNEDLIHSLTVNVPPQIQFMSDCLQQGVDKLIFLSSGGTVYGRPTLTPIPETHPTEPISSYGVTKLITEKYLNFYGQVHALNYIIVRLSNPIGPGQLFKRGQGLVPAILSRHNASQPLTIFGDGSALRDYVFIDDAVDALVRIIDRPQVSQTILNVASGEGRSILDVVAAIERVLGEELQKTYLPNRHTDVDVNILDISKARRLLDWSPKVDFEDGIRRTVLSLSQSAAENG